MVEDVFSAKSSGCRVELFHVRVFCARECYVVEIFKKTPESEEK